MSNSTSCSVFPLNPSKSIYPPVAPASFASRDPILSDAYTRGTGIEGTFCPTYYIVATSQSIAYTSSSSLTVTGTSGWRGSRTRAIIRVSSSAIISKQIQYWPAEKGWLIRIF